MRPADTTSRAELEAALLRRLRGKHSTIPRQPRPAGPARFPASPAQAEAWVRAMAEPELPNRVVLSGLRLRGPLDLPALERALAAVVARHETLRTVFELTDDGLVQVINPVVDVPVTVVEATEDDFAAQTLAALEPAIDLRTGPLIRFRLLRLAADDHIAIVIVHHAIADARAKAVLLADLVEAYLGAEPAPLPIQYADFAVWQREQLATPATATKIDHWLSRLAGASLVPIPADHPPYDGPTNRGDMLIVPVPDELFARLRGFARARGATVFGITLAAFQVLLARLSGTRDVTVAARVAFRDRAELENLIADFSQALVCRADLAGDQSFETLLATARDRFTEDFDHAVPRDLLVPKLPEHIAELFDRLDFGVDRATVTDGPDIGLRIEPLPPHWPYAERPLTFRFGHGDEHAQLYVTYRLREFSRARVADLAADYLTVLAGCLDRPADSPFGQGAPALRIS